MWRELMVFVSLAFASARIGIVAAHAEQGFALNALKDAAHIWIGMVLMWLLLSRERLARVLFWGLCAIEVASAGAAALLNR